MWQIIWEKPTCGWSGRCVGCYGVSFYSFHSTETSIGTIPAEESFSKSGFQWWVMKTRRKKPFQREPTGDTNLAMSPFTTSLSRGKSTTSKLERSTTKITQECWPRWALKDERAWPLPRKLEPWWQLRVSTIESQELSTTTTPRPSTLSFLRVSKRLISPLVELPREEFMKMTNDC